MDANNKNTGGVPLNIQRMKDLGNKLYKEGQHGNAVKVYSSAIASLSQVDDRASLDFIRTVLANRAACYLALEQYNEAIEDCTRILAKYPFATGTLNSELMQKVHYRLAKSYYHVEKHDEALAQLRLFNQLGGSSKLETPLRTSILQAQGKNPDDQTTPALPAPGSFLPLKYIVRVPGEDHGPVVYDELIPAELCVPNPPKTPSYNYLTELVKKHTLEVMRLKPWKCWNCPKQATSARHNPMAYVNLPEPVVIDWFMPLCRDWGKCDEEGKRFMCEEGAEDMRAWTISQRLGQMQL
ncbi:hypothetical protein MD484_g2843, partial [Candolleomyces efflorescens]